MPYNIAFYIHHHGSGHLMRSLAIAAHLNPTQVTFLGSNLGRFRSVIPEGLRCIHLPPDTCSGEDPWSVQREPSGLHYAPLSIAGQVKRVAILARYFSDNPHLLLVVDVSVEVAMLSTLCGVPTVIVRQHGKRDDLPHLLAYKNAVGLLAPYGQVLQPIEEEWLTQKTFFTGGFSRFSPRVDRADLAGKQVGILVGSGGTSIDEQFVSSLVGQCADWHFHLIGEIENIDKSYMAANLTVYGSVKNPVDILDQCILVIGNAGHNTVMEVASLNKRLVIIPESRPFDEQVIKAQMLEKLHLAKVILPELWRTTNWKELFSELIETSPDWKGIISDSAGNDAANYLKACFNQHFSLGH